MKNEIDDDIEIIYWGDDDTDELVNSEKLDGKKHHKKDDDIKWGKELFSWFKLITIAVVIALVINNFVIINANVPTGSMETTIHAKSRMIGFRLSYVFSNPERGDIIIFKYPDNHKENYVKRVIGLPGEYVEVKDGVVYINDKALSEDYTYFEGGLPDTAGDFKKTLIPDKCYFVMGDNRNNSFDSRFWKTTHFVKEEEILGKAVLSYYPKFYVLH